MRQIRLVIKGERSPFLMIKHLIINNLKLINMLKNIINQNAEKAKAQIEELINEQYRYIADRKENFYKTLIGNPSKFSIREQATFIGSCEATLEVLKKAYADLEEEFPTKRIKLERDLDLYGGDEREEPLTNPLDKG